jgi:hypothetical protein
MIKTASLPTALTLALLLCAPLTAGETAPATPEPSSESAVASPGAETDAPVADAESEPEEPAVPPMRFETPDAAAMALIEAAASEGRDALLAVLGSDLEELVSGDPGADAADRQRFVELAQDEADLEDETEDSAVLVVGPEDWPFPIPLAKDDRGWYFDTQAGIEEILDRRIGLN